MKLGYLSQTTSNKDSLPAIRKDRSSNALIPRKGNNDSKTKNRSKYAS